jgi:RNA polymerase sigma-70 factor (ECF subfamily)
MQILDGLKSGYKERNVQEKILYQRYEYFIEEGCRKYNLIYEDSFSAYTDALLSLLHNIISESFDGRSGIKTYFYQIFSNKCVDIVRKNTSNKQQVNKTQTASELLVQLPDAARTIVEQIIDNQKKDLIKKQLELIGEKCKEILLLFEDGFTDKEIAFELGYNNGSVAKTTRLRCLERLKERIGNAFTK